MIAKTIEPAHFIHFVALIIVNFEGYFGLFFALLNLINLEDSAVVPATKVVFTVDQVARLETPPPGESLERPRLEGCELKGVFFYKMWFMWIAGVEILNKEAI